MMEENKKSLYGITSDYIALEQQLIEFEGELTPELETALSINKDELKVKSEGYVGIINKLSSEVDFIDSEVKRLQDLKKVRKNAIKRLKTAIQTTMEIYNIDTIELPLNKISFRKSQSLEIDLPIDELPSKIIKIKKELINKNEIKKMLKEGNNIKGVKLVDNLLLSIK